VARGVQYRAASPVHHLRLILSAGGAAQRPTLEQITTDPDVTVSPGCAIPELSDIRTLIVSCGTCSTSCRVIDSRDLPVADWWNIHEFLREKAFGPTASRVRTCHHIPATRHHPIRWNIRHTLSGIRRTGESFHSSPARPMLRRFRHAVRHPTLTSQRRSDAKEAELEGARPRDCLPAASTSKCASLLPAPPAAGAGALRGHHEVQADSWSRAGASPSGRQLDGPISSPRQRRRHQLVLV